MKISWVKYQEDTDKFKLPERLGFDVYKINDLEKTDDKINELINNNYKTLIISNEVASFSQDIIKKYDTDKDIRIIIAP